MICNLGSEGIREFEWLGMMHTDAWKFGFWPLSSHLPPFYQSITTDLGLSEDRVHTPKFDR